MNERAKNNLDTLKVVVFLLFFYSIALAYMTPFAGHTTESLDMECGELLERAEELVRRRRVTGNNIAYDIYANVIDMYADVYISKGCGSSMIFVVDRFG